MYFSSDLIKSQCPGLHGPRRRNKGALGSFAPPSATVPLTVPEVPIWSNERKSGIVTHKRLCVGCVFPLHTHTASPWHLYQVVVKGSQPKDSSSCLPLTARAALPGFPNLPRSVPFQRTRDRAGPSFHLRRLVLECTYDNDV